MLNIEKELTRFSFIKELDILDFASQSIDSDGLRKVVELYNQALESLKSKSEDIAAIALKKAISIYPDFMEAKILLGLCYILREQFEQAENLLRSITDSDNSIAKAYQYLQYIENIHHKKVKKKNDLFSRKAPISISIKVPKFQFKIVSGIMIFTAGILIASVFFYNSLANFRKNSTVDTTKWSALEKTYQTQINTYKGELTTAEDNVQKLQRQLNDKDNEIAYLNNIKKILMVEKLYNEGNKDNAVEMLLTLKDIQFNDVEKGKYEALYAKIIPPLAREYYYKGYNLYNSGKYKEAIQPFNMSIQLNIKDSNEHQYALYLAAKCYQMIGDNVNAANYYSQVINLFPNSNYAEYSRNRLQELNAN